MLAAYLTRGVKAGLVAGIVLALFVAIVANPLVVYADETNHAVGESHHEEGSHAESAHGEGGHGDGDHSEPAVSLAATKAVSILSSGLWAVLLGGVVFGIAFYFLEPAIPGTGATKSYVLAGAGFVTVSGAPWLVLPPVAPGAEQSLAVDTRLLLYGGMMVAGALTCLLAGYVYKRVSASSGRLVAGLAAVLPFGLLAIPAVLAPTNAVEGALAPELRTGLVGLVVFGQLLVWLALAATHAQLRPGDGAQAGTTSPASEAAIPAD